MRVFQSIMSEFTGRRQDGGSRSKHREKQCLFRSYDQNVEQNHNIKINNKNLRICDTVRVFGFKIRRTLVR